MDERAELRRESVGEGNPPREELVASYRYLASILESMLDAVIVANPDGTIRMVNGAVLEMLGYAEEELIDQPVGTILEEEEEEEEEEELFFRGTGLAKLVREGAARNVELRLLTKSGERIPVAFNGSVIREQEGRLAAVVGVARDTRVLKRAEAQLARHNAVLDGMNKVFREALKCETEEELCRTCLAVAEALTGSKFGWIGELSQAGRLDTIAISGPGWDACRMPASEGTKLIRDMEVRGIWGRVLKDGEALIVNDLATHPDRVGTPEGHPPLTSFMGIPLKQAGVTVGVIALANKESGYDLPDKEAIETLSATIVEALMRKRAEVRLKESEEHYRALVEVAGYAGEGVVLIQDTEGVEAAVLFANDEFVRLTGYSREELTRTSFLDMLPSRFRRSVAERYRRRLGGEIIPGVFEYSIISKGGKEIPIAITGGGLVYKGRPAVVIYARDITEQKRVEEELRRRNRQLATLSSVSQSLSRSKGLDQVLKTALDSVLGATGLGKGEILLLDAAAEELVLVAHRGLSEEFVQAFGRLPLGVGIAGEVARTGKTIVTNNVPELIEASMRSAYKREGIQSTVSVPLRSKDKILGVLNIGSDSYVSLPAEDMWLLETLANEIGVAIENAQLLERVSELSITDDLTGLYNRRHFYERLEAEIYRTQRYGRCFALVMLDIDWLKKYNDRFGHTAGDRALKSFGRTLKSVLRKSDMAFRYGGDEFAIILPATEAERARKLVDRFRSKWLEMAKAEYLILESPLVFSAGIARFPEDAEASDGLVFMADTALYQAKRQGGCKSILASELGTPPPDTLGMPMLDQVYALAATVDARDPHTYDHSRQVATISQMIGKAIGLSQKELADLETASLLHDVGKVGVPDSILTKPGILTKPEWTIMRKHVVAGAKIVGYIKELAPLIPMILHHHERYDGTGYPDGLKGEQIPLGARIIAVADAYATMVTLRPYGSIMSSEEALEELRRCSGTQFDPKIVGALCQAPNELR